MNYWITIIGALPIIEPLGSVIAVTDISLGGFEI